MKAGASTISCAAVRAARAIPAPRNSSCQPAGRSDAHLRFGAHGCDPQRLGLETGEAIAHPWVNKALEKAQQKVEARNFEIRKNILKYDNVLNDQRKVIFEQRKEIMSADDVIRSDRRYPRAKWSRAGRPPHSRKRPMPNNGTRPGCKTKWQKSSRVDLPIVDWTKEEGIADEEVRERILKAVETRAAERAANFGTDVMRYVEKAILLQTLDTNWREHIVNLDHLRQYVGLRGYGQRDPLNEYKSEAFELFEALLAKLRSDVMRPADACADPDRRASTGNRPQAASRHAGKPYRSLDRRR